MILPLITSHCHPQEVKDTRWLSQEKAISNLQRNLPAVLATLAEEADLKKDPVARGLYTYCATYRFVAAVHLQADILPHLARLSKLFQKENVNFMAIKNHVSCHVFSTDVYFNFLIIACQLVIKNKIMFDLHVYLGSCHNWDTEANKGSPEGSFLAQVNEKVNNLNIDAEEERVRRDRGRPTSTGRFWTKFQNEVSSTMNI